MRLTKYGRQVLNRTIAVAALLVMTLGALVLLFNGAAHVLGIRQEAYNVLYIALVMPISFAVMSYIAYAEYDKEHQKMV